jgi:hypothetical protein
VRPDKDRRIVERVLADFIEGRSRDELEHLVKSFQRFLEGSTSLINELLLETGHPSGAAMSPTVYRWFMHTSIWRRNTSAPEALQEELFRRILEHMRRYTRISARFELPDENGVLVPVMLSPQGIKSTLTILCRTFGIHLYEPPRRRQKQGASPGYDRSHVQPFAENGEGPTTLEPAPRNRARGKQTNGESAT